MRICHSSISDFLSFPDRDSCNGDSGGPLISRAGGIDGTMYLTGIVSFGTEKCGVGVPAVFTSIRYYMNWIVKNMKP